MIASGDYTASFALSLMRKDAGSSARRRATPRRGSPLIARSTELLERAERDGLGDGDYSGITELFRRA